MRSFKSIFCFLLVIGTVYDSYTQSTCLQNGITFSTQSSINNFTTNFPNCTVILGDVTITNLTVTNLNGLASVTQIGGDLRIENTNIQSLNGLTNLMKVGGRFCA